MTHVNCLRKQALEALILSDPCAKVTAVEAINLDGDYVIDLNADYHEIAERAAIPGRPSKPELVDPKAVGMRSVHTEEGRATLMHAIAHIEFNAINLHLDIVWRFPQQSEQFYLDWLAVAKEEAKHFRLLRQRLAAMGYDYGAYTAHNGLWDMAEKTKGDLLARLALVPRTLEARGLDVTPGIQQRLAQVGDSNSVAILDIILNEEVGHVAIGNRWYLAECAALALDPIEAYANLLKQYGVANPKGPFNKSARQLAGFSDEELAWLESLEQDRRQSPQQSKH
ncbi:ferritin-like domain-containing protein [Oligella urethralis]|uniref:ferritin-like domain-containing protein n=1 Tax=Oligella urethralis TaxID=90245 RepID=UPI0027BAED2E|nr:ferritin-like domain-containing protein [Oligella urethralis]